MNDETHHIGPDEPAPEPEHQPPPATRPIGRVVRIGCAALGLFGLLGLALGATAVSDPAQGRCAQARNILEDDGDVDDAGDVECDEAVSRAIALGEEDDDVASVPTESTVRTYGFILAGIGLLQAVGAVLTLRTRTKAMRLAALVGAGLGIIFSPLGLIGIPVLGFVVYAILFSGDARAVFGEPGGPRMFRPRT